MGARELLIDILYGEASPTGEREGDADKILNMFAHELAEKIRAIPAPVRWYEPYAEGVWRKARSAAADLIDPEVET